MIHCSIDSVDYTICFYNFCFSEVVQHSLERSAFVDRASVLTAVAETLQGFVNVYEGFNSFPEIFSPISKVLRKLAEQHHMPEILQNKLSDIAQHIEKKADEHHILRQPLRMRKQKPVPIKMLNPKFEDK